MLNLQCATGESAAELAELGALVTGVDISTEALDVARERWPDIAWVQADVHDLPSELKRGRFDLVYTAEGVLAWLLDLDAWAGGHRRRAAQRRRPPPVRGASRLAVRRRVAALARGLLRRRTLHVYRGWSHFELPGRPRQEEKVERFWRLGQVVTALARAGLVLRQLEEYPGTTLVAQTSLARAGHVHRLREEAVVSNR